VDYVVSVDRIGDPKKIASAAARITQDPRDLMMAENCARVMTATEYFRNGFSFQTGVGGPSIAVTRFLKPLMLERGIKMKWAAGGITAPMVELLNEGLIDTIVDTQDFDLEAVKSVSSHPRHLKFRPPSMQTR
jgi:citrate lyase subunit alpha/citrate CoA-transferase